MVMLFVLYFFVYQNNKIVLTYKDAAGLWWQDRFRPYVVMSVNLVVNIISVQVIGIYGVILSTILCMTVAVPWATYIVFKYLFKQKCGEYILDFVKNMLLTGLACFITYGIGKRVTQNITSEMMELFVLGVVCCIVPNIVFILANRKSQLFQEGLRLVKGILKR